MNIQFVFLRIAPIYQITFERVPRALSQIVQTPTTWRFLFCFVYLFLFLCTFCNIFSAAEHSPGWSYREPRRTLQGALQHSASSQTMYNCTFQTRHSWLIQTFFTDRVYCFDEGHWQETDANGGFQGHQKLFSNKSLNLDTKMWLRRYYPKT